MCIMQGKIGGPVFLGYLAKGISLTAPVLIKTAEKLPNYEENEANEADRLGGGQRDSTSFPAF